MVQCGYNRAGVYGVFLFDLSSCIKVLLILVPGHFDRVVFARWAQLPTDIMGRRGQPFLKGNKLSDIRNCLMPRSVRAPNFAVLGCMRSKSPKPQCWTSHGPRVLCLNSCGAQYM